MRTFVVVFVALCAMAYAQVRVVDQPGQTYKIAQKPDQAFYRPSNGPNIYPDQAFYQPSNGPNIVPDQAFYQPSNGPNIVPDSAFYRPSVNPNGPGTGPVQPSHGPTFVNNNRPQYPYKQYDNPLARGGK